VAHLSDTTQVAQAAELAMDNPAFYNGTIKQFATPRTN